MSSESTVTTETRGHVFLMGLDRPRKRNAFSLAMLRDLALAFTEYERRPELWCAVLFGHGDDFTSGLDLAEVGPAVAGGSSLFPEGAVDPMGLLEPRRTKPLVMAVKGFCYTIGVELLLAADVRVAARSTRLAQMEVRRGIMPFGGATLRLPAQVGWGNAMKILLTGGELSAEEAHRIGLVQDVTDDGAELDRAVALATEIASRAPLAVQAALRSARRAVEQGHAAALAALLDDARALMGTEDAMEGVMSFIERREARFQGR